MSLDHTKILCPRCHYSTVNMTGEPVVTHVREEHGWYGQCHTVTIPFQCSKCKQDFVHEVVAYKETATARNELVQ